VVATQYIKPETGPHTMNKNRQQWFSVGGVVGNLESGQDPKSLSTVANSTRIVR
jgi:hypothetical protein